MLCKDISATDDLCEARRGKRSILVVCEHFGDRRFVLNLPIRTLPNRKIVND